MMKISRINESLTDDFILECFIKDLVYEKEKRKDNIYR